MEPDKFYLNNELTLPAVAEQLGITIHDTSYLINQVTSNNFYHFVNRYRMEEAKKLLASAKANELNMIDIAFAAGFNSKKTFNTAFKKSMGCRLWGIWTLWTSSFTIKISHSGLCNLD